MKARTTTVLFVLIVQLINAQKPELMVPTGHTENIFSIALSNDGKFLVTGSNTVKLFETQTGREIRTFTGHNSTVVRSVAISPNRKFVASGGLDKKINIWDLETGVNLFSVSESPIYGVAFTNDSKFLITASKGGMLKMIDIQKASVVKQFIDETPKPDKKNKNYENPEKSKGFTAISISPNGQKVVVGDKNGQLKVFDLKSLKVIKEFTGFSTEQINAIAFNSDGTKISVVSEDSKGYLFDFTTGIKIAELKGHTKPVYSTAFSPDGKYLITGGLDNKIKFWNPNTGEEIRLIHDLGTGIYALAFSADSRYIYIGGKDTEIKQLDLNKRQQTGLFKAHADAISAIDITNDGQTLIVGSWDNTIKTFDLSGNKIVFSWLAHNDLVRDIQLSPNNKYLVSGSYDKTMKVWDFSSRKLVRTYGPYAGPVGSFFYVTENQVMGSAVNEDRILFWNVNETKEFGKNIPKKENQPYVTACRLSSDNNFWFVGLSDGCTWFWDENNKSLPARFDSRGCGKINAMTITSDDQHLAMATEKCGIQLHKIDRKWVTSKNQILFDSKAIESEAVAFSPNGELLAGEGTFNTIFLWNVETGEKIRELRGHTGQIASLAFSPDGKLLFSGGKDAKIMIWDTQFGTPVATLFLLDQNEWAIVSPTGYFDATPNAMKLLYYVQGVETLPLESFYEKFYTPNLLARILAGEDFYSAPTILTGKLKLPPLVTIITPNSGEEIISSETKVIVEATDMGGGVDEIRLYLNGKLVSEEQRGFIKSTPEGRKITKEFSVILPGGTNELKAVALNLERTESTPHTITVESKATEAMADLYLISVGIDDYKNPQYKLNYGKTDAQAFAQSVEQKGSKIFKQVKKIEIFDSKATKTEIINAFTSVISNSKPQDVFIFFYAGHGVMGEVSNISKSDFYLALYDVTQLYGKPEMLQEKAISALELKDLCSKIKAQKQVIFLDACQSGGAVETFAMRGAAEEKAILQLGRSTGIVVFASTGTDQFATEFNDLKHGVFTYALLQGLDGAADGGTKDQKITVKEIDAYLNDVVPELTQKYRGTTQYPKVWSSGMDFPIAVIKY